jgi:hypothetical protein
MQRADGKIRTVLLRAYPRKDDGDRVAGLVGCEVRGA